MTRALSDHSSIELHFVRVYAQRVYGIPLEQIVGTAGGTKYVYGREAADGVTLAKTRGFGE